MTLSDLLIPPLPAEFAALPVARRHEFPADDPSAVSDAKAEYWRRWRAANPPKEQAKA